MGDLLDRHEALTLTNLVADMIDHLLMNNAIRNTPIWSHTATEIHELIMGLHRSIRDRHMQEGMTCRAKDYYKNDCFDERLCDYCHNAYRGPAVYCSLTCAQADA